MSNKFNIDNLEMILLGASALERVDEVKNALKELEDIKGLDNNVSLDVIHELARTIKLPEKYVDTYINMKFPTKDAQLKTAKMMGSVESAPPKYLAYVYQEFILRALNQTFPLETFRCQGLSTGELGKDHFYDPSDPEFGIEFRKVIEKKEIEKKSFGRKEERVTTEEERLARVTFTTEESKKQDRPSLGKYNIRIEILSPFFAEACSEYINGLRKEFSDVIEDYKVISRNILE